MKIGAQLYTVRKSCTTLADFEDTLKRVADIGYKTVQVSGVCDYEADWLAEKLRQTGLECVLTHIHPAKLKDEPQKVVTDHKIFGCNYVGLGCCFKRDETLDGFENDYTPLAKLLKDNGMYFMYHNHAHEFEKKDGITLLERIAERMPGELMGFTLDTYWVQTAGGDPAAWLERLAGRVPCIHLKDHKFDHSMAVVGEGNINFDRVFEKAEAAGTEYMLVEQDDCYGEDPFDCLKRSYEYLRSRGFE